MRFILKSSAAGRNEVVIASGTTRESLVDEILVRVPVEREVTHLHQDYRFANGRDFTEQVSALGSQWTQGQRFTPVLGKDCGSCEYRIADAMKVQGLKSGFDECWLTEGKLSPADLKRPFVFDVWNFRKAQEILDDNRVFMDQIEQEDLAPKSAASRKKGEEPRTGLSQQERQWLQIQTVKDPDTHPYLDTEGLSAALSALKFPLNFIDFETSRVAIPFHEGRRPYEQIAFQFSHHLLHEDGRLEHKKQWIDRERGRFPNFDFVRNLKKALESNSGTILRYANHENSVLNDILEQLRDASTHEVPDKKQLSEWIRTVTRSSGKSEEKWEGSRCMVDLWDWVKKYFYHPATEGSNSIKDVLPAVLRESKMLQERYSKPIYGVDGGIPSLNYVNHTWIRFDASGQVMNPYQLLDHEIAEGGAAMSAWARMQFTQMSDIEADQTVQALLRYCELDTLSMVLIYQYWVDALQNAPSRQADSLRVILPLLAGNKAKAKV